MGAAVARAAARRGPAGAGSLQQAAGAETGTSALLGDVAEKPPGWQTGSAAAGLGLVVKASGLTRVGLGTGPRTPSHGPGIHYAQALGSYQVRHDQRR
jgi:hypothetical protein